MIKALGGRVVEDVEVADARDVGTWLAGFGARVLVAIC